MINQVLTKLISLPRPLLVVLILLVAATLWLDKAVQPPAVVEDGTARRDPDFMIEGLSAIRMGHDGMELYKLSAKKLLHYPRENVAPISPAIAPTTTSVVQKVVPLTPKAQTPDKLPVRLKADLVELYGSNDEIYLSGNVSLLRDINKDSNKKLKIVTSSLSVFPDKGVARTDKAVFITEGSAIINAVGMEIDNDANVTRLLSQVKVVHHKK